MFRRFYENSSKKDNSLLSEAHAVHEKPHDRSNNKIEWKQLLTNRSKPGQENIHDYYRNTQLSKIQNAI